MHMGLYSLASSLTGSWGHYHLRGVWSKHTPSLWLFAFCEYRILSWWLPFGAYVIQLLSVLRYSLTPFQSLLMTYVSLREGNGTHLPTKVTLFVTFTIDIVDNTKSYLCETHRSEVLSQFCLDCVTPICIPCEQSHKVSYCVYSYLSVSPILVMWERQAIPISLLSY